MIDLRNNRKSDLRKNHTLVKTKETRIQKELHKPPKKQGEEKLIESQIEDVENSQDDSRRMHQAIRILQNKYKQTITYCTRPK